MGQCMSDSKNNAERFDVEKHVSYSFFITATHGDVVRSHSGSNVLAEVPGTSGGKPHADTKEEEHEGRTGSGRRLKVSQHYSILILN